MCTGYRIQVANAHNCEPASRQQIMPSLNNNFKQTTASTFQRQRPQTTGNNTNNIHPFCEWGKSPFSPCETQACRFGLCLLCPGRFVSGSFSLSVLCVRLYETGNPYAPYNIYVLRRFSSLSLSLSLSFAVCACLFLCWSLGFVRSLSLVFGLAVFTRMYDKAKRYHIYILHIGAWRLCLSSSLFVCCLSVV